MRDAYALSLNFLYRISYLYPNIMYKCTMYLTLQKGQYVRIEQIQNNEDTTILKLI